MDVIGAVLLVGGIGLLAASVGLWFGRVEWFPSSLRLNHAGVICLSGMFFFITGLTALVLKVGSVSLPRLGTLFAIWMISSVGFLWMYARTPATWSSRMAWQAQRAPSAKRNDSAERDGSTDDEPSETSDPASNAEED